MKPFFVIAGLFALASASPAAPPEPRSPLEPRCRSIGGCKVQSDCCPGNYCRYFAGLGQSLCMKA
ncbi:unnamed protein product [Clonostachys solani]|uniref:Uncharacterized protein n=1 Tax=Clonostachys solani TaxID=160281 RepID=A0A9N9ZES4_9HYPO|nr:unnamed protein product [Clonostachys solani]